MPKVEKNMDDNMFSTVQGVKEDAPIKRQIEPEDIKFPMINEKSKPIP